MKSHNTTHSLEISADFMEQTPLFTWEPGNFEQTTVHGLRFPQVCADCKQCKNKQTFVRNSILAPKDRLAHQEIKSGDIFQIEYLCASCRTSKRVYVLEFLKDGSRQYFQKIGQNPKPTLELDPELAIALGMNEHNFSKGLLCESQGLGFGAYAYFRSVVEAMLPDMIADVTLLVAEEDMEEFQKGMNEIAEKKSPLGKLQQLEAYVPTILKPAGQNPIARLVKAFNLYLYEQDDFTALTYANEIKVNFVFLIKQIGLHKRVCEQYLESMRRLDQKKEKIMAKDSQLH